MNLREIHTDPKEVSAKLLFSTTDGVLTALQIQENALLKEHTTKVPAMLICVSGEVVFENEKGFKQALTSGDYVPIEPLVKHWVKGVLDSQLLLIK
ncbi:MAG: hypothetical protein JNN28_19710 [Saprospiraceae bacterium]|nr:hypothetical protein [Saprospiraceae bacterium]